MTGFFAREFAYQLEAKDVAQPSSSSVPSPRLALSAEAPAKVCSFRATSRAREMRRLVSGKRRQAGGSLHQRKGGIFQCRAQRIGLETRSAQTDEQISVFRIEPEVREDGAFVELGDVDVRREPDCPA